jgi:hypothetical protein
MVSDAAYALLLDQGFFERETIIGKGFCYGLHVDVHPGLKPHLSEWVDTDFQNDAVLCVSKAHLLEVKRMLYAHPDRSAEKKIADMFDMDGLRKLLY